MKQRTNMLMFIVSFVLTLVACNQPAKTDEVKTEPAAKTETAYMPAYDAALDPVNVEAKFLKMHKDTLGIKLYEVTLNPGDSVGLHNHPDHVLYIAQGGVARLYDKDGNSQVAELPTGTAMIAPAQAHAGINIGTTPIKFIVTDIYRPRN
jgi:quercetin dioxygenase-like cupin family protein